MCSWEEEKENESDKTKHTHTHTHIISTWFFDPTIWPTYVRRSGSCCETFSIQMVKF